MQEGRKLYKETIEDAGRSLFEIIVDMYPSFKVSPTVFLHEVNGSNSIKEQTGFQCVRRLSDSIF